jgi:WD40 repeat protein
VRLWDGRTFVLRETLEISSEGVLSLAWSPDGNHLAIGLADGSLALGEGINSHGNTTVRIQNQHQGILHALAWSPGGQRLATGDALGVLRIWEAQGFSPGPELRDVRLESDLKAVLPPGVPDTAIQHQATIFDLSWSPDGLTLSAATRFGTIRLWDALSGQPGPMAEVGAGLGVPALDWSPEGGLLAWGTGQGRLFLADPRARQRCGFPLGHAGGVWSVAWSPHGGFLASGGEDGMVRIWSVREVWTHGLEHAGTPGGHGGAALAVSWSGDGARMVSTGADLTARCWSADSGEELGTLEGLPAPTLALTPSQSGVLLAPMMASREMVRNWEAPADPPLDLAEVTGPVFSLALSPDGRLLASGDSSETIWLRDLTTGESAGVLFPPEFEGSQQDSPSILPVWALTWSPDGHLLASDAKRATVVWDVETRKPRRILDVRVSEANGDSVVSDFGFAEDGGIAISADQRALAWAPDGSQLAWRGEGGSICIWELKSDQIHRLEGHTGKVYALAWSRDGRLLASASGDRSIRVWHVGERRCLAVTSCLSPAVAIRFEAGEGLLRVADDGFSTNGKPLPYLFSMENLDRGR